MGLNKLRDFRLRRLSSFFWKNGFIPTKTDLCILAYEQNDIFIIEKVYVDDFAVDF